MVRLVLLGRTAAALCLLAAIVPTGVCAQTTDNMSIAQTAPLTERRLKIPLRAEGGDFELDALLVRPPGDGPFPLAVITHGTSRDVPLRQKVRPDWLVAEARSFARRGWSAAVVVPPRLRRFDRRLR
jgi:hypothetical protein